MTAREVKDILIALNSAGPCMFKYPIGNAEFTARVRKLESDGVIKYDPITSTWAKRTDKLSRRLVG